MHTAVHYLLIFLSDAGNADDHSLAALNDDLKQKYDTVLVLHMKLSSIEGCELAV